ncbi:MAG: hypothetical protein E7484_04510 [Ruminococcaceae bacterium]|nr:hypothetical protein [Oscillospiraceae bacterium]
MKCPWCRKEMTEGYINSARQVVFSKNANEDFFYFGNKEDVKLTQHNWTRPSAKSYHCENCKKVVVDYDIEIE